MWNQVYKKVSIYFAIISCSKVCRDLLVRHLRTCNGIPSRKRRNSLAHRPEHRPAVISQETLPVASHAPDFQNQVHGVGTQNSQFSISAQNSRTVTGSRPHFIPSDQASREMGSVMSSGAQDLTFTQLRSSNAGNPATHLPGIPQQYWQQDKPQHAVSDDVIHPLLLMHTEM